MSLSDPSRDPRRTGARILDTAEGVLIGLRRYSLNQAFVELVDTAKRHDVSPVSLADALVAIAQMSATDDLDQRACEAARNAWGDLLYRYTGGRSSAKRRGVVYETDGHDDTSDPDADVAADATP